jgi:hypothetical protein
MDLTQQVPRSANERMAGVVSLARTTDKARAFNEGKLGEYDYDCPHDKPLFAFLGTDGTTFARKVEELESDAAIENWVRDELLADKTPEAIEAFNDERRNWRPDDHSQGYFDQLRGKVAPGREDVTTWFDLLDLDEGRTVTAPHR